MPTIDGTSGFEVGDSGTGGIFGVGVGTPTISTTTVHSGAQAMECSTSAAASYRIHTPTAGTTRVVRFYIRFAVLPAATSVLFQFVNANGSASFKVNASGLALVRMGASAADVSTGLTLATNTWYLVDGKCDTSGATATATVSINGGSSATDTHAQTSANITSQRVGQVTSQTVDVFFDDYETGPVLGDYPFGGTGGGPTITGIVNAGTIAARARLEVQFDVSGTWSATTTAAYDPTQGNVYATVTSPGAVVTTQICYFAQKYTAGSNTSGHGQTPVISGSAHWYFAYKFPSTGAWTFTLTAVTGAGTVTTVSQNVTVTALDATTAAVAGGHLSPWRIANTMYFTLDDGTFLPMIGQNSNIEARDYTLDGEVGFTKFLGYVAANGGTVIRFLMSSYHRDGMEWTPAGAQYSGWDNYYSGLGIYSQQNARRIDAFMATATSLGLTVLFCYNTHGEFSTSSDARWTDSPYNSANSGPIASADPAGLFTNATALTYQQNKIRYILARWGSSPAFGAIEHQNEGGSVGNGFFAGLNTVANQAAFIQTMGTYIRTIDPWQHLMTWSEEWEPQVFPGSAGQHTDPIFQNSTIDFSCLHAYQNSPWVINDRRATTGAMIRDMQLRLGKPALHAEAGLYRTPSVPEANFDPSTSGLSGVQKDHLLAGTHVRETSLANLATGFSGGWEWWYSSGLAEDASKHRVSGTLPYGGSAVDTWAFPLDPAYQAAAAIMAGETPQSWASVGGPLTVTSPTNTSPAAWGYNQRAFVYVEDTANNYGGSEVANLVGRTESGTMTLQGLLDGIYTIETWTTRAPGGLLSSTMASSIGSLPATQAEFSGGDPTGVADSQAALQTFFNANSGKVVGLPANAIYRLNSALILTSWAGTVIGRNAKFQPHYTSGTKFYPLEILGANHITIHDLELDGSQVTTPATTAALIGTNNTREQEHAIAIYGGTAITLINVKTHNFWGDGIWLTRWTLGGGDGSSPTNVTVYNHTADQHGRNAISVISSGGIGYYLNSTTTNIGFDSFDIEPNSSADVVGSWVINNCSFSTYDLLNNAQPNNWGNGVAISSGGSSAVTRPSLDVRQVTIQKPSTSSTGMTIRYTTTFIADSNQSDTGVACNFTTVPTIDWGTNTNITPSPAQGFTSPPGLTLPNVNGVGSISWASGTIDRDTFFKLYPVGGSVGAFLAGVMAAHSSAAGALSSGIALAGVVVGRSSVTGTFGTVLLRAPANVTVDYQSTSDVDVLYVRGSTPAGSGYFPSTLYPGFLPPRNPPRAALLDAPHATDRTSASAAAQTEFARRQGLATVTAIVTSTANAHFDGWAKGQQVLITNAVYGWVAKPFVINAVNMVVLTGTGLRQYTLTCGTEPISFMRRISAGRAGAIHRPVSGPRIIGTMVPGGGMPDQ